MTVTVNDTTARAYGGNVANDFRGEAMEIQEPAMSVSIGRLNIGELRVIQGWSGERFEAFPTFCPWIHELLTQELNRRADPLIELSMHTLPQWSGEQLADALQGSYVLVRLSLTPAIAAWADELHKLIVCNCAAALEQFAGEVVT